MCLTVRSESSSDIGAIHDVNVEAFGQPAEADLVDALRAAGGAALSLVAEDGDGSIVGHILFSPVTVRCDSDGSLIDVRALGLAPMAVLPRCQREGVGTALVRAGLDQLRAQGVDAVFVLGHPAYYPRFGFERASAFGKRWEHDAPDEAFMALELRAGVLGGDAATVAFRPEFAGV